MAEEYLLEMIGISKSFGLNQVLDEIHINVRAGEVLALLGENGAGKSTLIKILGGIYSKDKVRYTLRETKKKSIPQQTLINMEFVLFIRKLYSFPKEV